MSALELDKNKAIDLLNSGSISHEEISILAKKLKELEKTLEQKTERWFELSENN
jgi:hypothetical protein